MQPPKMTPLMEQYWEIKSRYENEIVLFRMGDFYEMFHRDAELAAPVLNIALTQRNKKANDPTKMCGVPHHSIAGPIAKLLQAGYKVAICDQIEDPAEAKGIVKRAVTRVLTPGMVYDPDTLDQLAANYLAAYDAGSVAFVDVTTGEAFRYDVEVVADREEILTLLRPVELVLTARQISEREKSEFRPVLSCQDTEDEDEFPAIGRLRAYIRRLQGADVLRALGAFEVRRRGQHLRLSSASLRHLEIFENSRGERKGTLFGAVNRTQTSAGARLLKSWLTAPLLDAAEIGRRQDEIAAWLERGSELREFRQGLGRLGDIERRLGKVHGSLFGARDLLAIAHSIVAGRELTEVHPGRPGIDGLSAVAELAVKIERTLVEEPPPGVKEGGLVRRGTVPELDELIDLTQNAQRLLLDLEDRERKRTGIASLKVRYNNVFGYYIELTKTHSHKAPGNYLRKQTLVNAERFTTDELAELEGKILSAKARRDQLEFEIFSGLRQEVLALAPDLIRINRIWTRWDVLSSLAWLALERGYVRPSMAPGGEALRLESSRHPVIEQTLASGFTPNSVVLEPGGGLLLTGPNMAGKSTLMRQVALIAILAQVGSFVPASSARLPLFDGLYTRIGASDALNEGLSTFMVEMTETAQILRAVSPHSLVILDEIGRGTSTYDGLSLAQAVLEFLLAEKRPYLLFATHYHELQALAGLFPQLRNAHMSVREQGGRVQFLHTLKDGPANRSYGIHVARLAGLPPAVTSRAAGLLKDFEGGASHAQLSLHERGADDSSLPETLISPWDDRVRGLDLARMTPLEALNKLFEWQREVSS